MKVAAFHGSPRPGGNSELLLKEALKGVRESGLHAMVFRPARMKLKPCRACGGCGKTGRCVMGDEMNKIYDAIRTCERIIVASPVFFLGLPAQIKAMIDRCQAFWSEKYLLKRPLPQGERGRRGLVFLVGGTKTKRGYTCAGATLSAFFRTISVEQHETLAFTGIDERGAIRRRPMALAEAYEAGKRLALP